MYMKLSLRKTQDFQLDKYESIFKTSANECNFCDDMGNLYKPIIYGGDYSDPNPKASIIVSCLIVGTNRVCIQYFIYWLEQNCLGLLPIADHTYDYEAIFIYLRPPEIFPVGIVNTGYSKSLGMSCRFHKTEIRREEYTERDFNEYEFPYKTSPAPSYPFGGSNGLNGSTCIRKYPLAGTVYMKELQPLFGIASCSHVFSGAEKDLHGRVLSLQTLKRLDDKILHEWYFEHYKNVNEEPFGYDVSDPFDFPYIKYSNPKPNIDSAINKDVRP